MGKLCKMGWNSICDGGKTRDSAGAESIERSRGCVAGTRGCGGTSYGFDIPRTDVDVTGTDGDVSGARGGVGRCSTELQSWWNRW
jgi:hypothetical protein